MTEEKVREAIAAGGSSRDDKAWLYPIQHKRGFITGPPIAFFTTPFSRVVMAARDANAKDKAFAPNDVTPEMIAPEVHVYTLSRPVEISGRRTMADVEAVVVTPAGSKDRNRAVQPTRTRETGEQYKNLLGAEFEGRSMVAVFPLSVLSEENDIHIVFDKRIQADGFSCIDCAVRFRLKDVRRSETIGADLFEIRPSD